MSDFHSDSMQRLFRAISLLQNEKEAAAFFDDLCTIRELQDMSQRLETAILLDKGRNYQFISAEVGVSTATISRVNRCLSYGPGGYKTIIDRLKEENDEH